VTAPEFRPVQQAKFLQVRLIQLHREVFGMVRRRLMRKDISGVNCGKRPEGLMGRGGRLVM
jgi:hypothetical protein